MAHTHARIIQHPLATSIQGALLDSYKEERSNGLLHVTLNIHALERTSSVLFEQEGNIWEHIKGKYVPTRLHFSEISELKGNDSGINPADLCGNDITRTIDDLLAWRQPKRQDMFFVFFMHEADNLMFFANRMAYESFPDESTFITLERNWSSAPPWSARLVPRPRSLHKRFGGDPITVKVNGHIRHHKLFIGGTDIQPKRRPQVNAVLNLGENPSRWVKVGVLHPNDRAGNKGEGSQGMSLDEICKEANWVIERLQKNQSVLVHCAAGMNRSSTICCAALMLLEGLCAEDALLRVREHHPWARPDSHHWLKLRWLANSKLDDTIHTMRKNVRSKNYHRSP